MPIICLGVILLTSLTVKVIAKKEEFSRKRSLGNQIRHPNVQTEKFCTLQLDNKPSGFLNKPVNQSMI